MAKKKQFVTAAAAFAVAASAVTPAITADAATKTVRLSSDFVRAGNLDAALDKSYNGGEIHWYKSSVDMNKLGVFQTAKGFVKGQGLKVEKRVRVLNYAQDIQPEGEIVLEQGVPASGLRVQPVLFADGNHYAKPVAVAGFNTDKVGEFEGTFTYANKAFGTVTKTVKYKVVDSAVKFENVKGEVTVDTLVVSADVKNVKEDTKAEVLIYPGKDASKAIPVTATIKDGKLSATVTGLPVGQHSFVIKSADVLTEAVDFEVKAVVKEVKYLNKAEVAVVIDAAVADQAGFTITVRNDKGELVAVKPVDVVRGQKEVLFTFEKPVTGDFNGVWTFGGFAYDFEAIKKFDAIVNASNQVAFYNALLNAGITGVSADYIAAYQEAVVADTKKANLADIQAIINKVNKAKEEATVEGAAAKRVNESKNQVQLLSALQAGFDRVNADWIAAYGKPLFSGENTYAQIQAIVDAENKKEITKLEVAVDTVAKANALVRVIETYYTPDSTEKDAPTPKADLIAKVREAAARYAVKEAPSVLSFYNALVSLANFNEKDALKVADLNDELKVEYFELKADKDTDYTSIALIKSTIVEEGAANARERALDKLKAVEAEGEKATSLTDLKALLADVAKVTKHETDEDLKFDLSTVVDARLADYRLAISKSKTLDNVVGLQHVIAEVNAKANRTVYLEKVRTSNSVTEVRDGILALALSSGDTRPELAKTFINAPSQIKLEATEYVLKERAKFADKEALEEGITLDTLFADKGVLDKALKNHAAKLDEFNNVGKLSDAKIADTKAKLDTYGYAPYAALSAVQKVAVAEEFNKLTKKVGDNYVSLDFSGADKVTTLKAANAFIDTAIANAR